MKTKEYRSCSVRSRNEEEENDVQLVVVVQRSTRVVRYGVDTMETPVL
jgi:hypothetical protein